MFSFIRKLWPHKVFGDKKGQKLTSALHAHSRFYLLHASVYIVYSYNTNYSMLLVQLRWSQRVSMDNFSESKSEIGFQWECTQIMAIWTPAITLQDHLKSLNTTTSTPYAHIRSEDCSNLIPKVAECSHFNSSAGGFVRSSGWPSHLILSFPVQKM